ncbi:MAG: hypothetical protein ACRDJJ_05705 [Actinomycetota bacterium]
MNASRVVATVALATVVALASVAPSRALDGQAPSDGRRLWVGTFQAAEAIWLVSNNRKAYAYLVFAFRVTSFMGRDSTWLLATRSRCRLRRGKGLAHATCWFRGRPRRIPATRFRFDTLLNNARVSWRGVKVRWKGRGSLRPDAGPFLDASPRSVFFDLEVSALRSALASGRVLRRTLTKRNQDLAAISRGVFVGFYLRPGERPRTELVMRARIAP